MLHLEIKHLRLVTHIAEVANFTRAAHMVCLSQSALSKQLAELEEWLGFALFYSTRIGMCLTDPDSGCGNPQVPATARQTHVAGITADARLHSVSLAQHRASDAMVVAATIRRL
ncbi:LysR family transcriptional regulator [Rhodoferax sp.]|uniref:helix-turn-helix domain-containing protein n=1 Tax=Rhodoferax sp. TaxID=50421 RepID=UPI002731288A|nr:LysR family transcriptional regulator [Rhodoferax sp.]MDP2440044.1 LysR family transcriptional regulator [Rhodoferax sp.]